MVDKSLKSICHCGNIAITLPRTPEEINECQCTICRRYAAAWCYFKVDEVKIDIKDDAKVQQYIWGDKERGFKFCSNCGCVCYHWPFELKNEDGSPARCGINTRNMDPMDVFYVDRKIERSWVLQPINTPANAHPDDRATY